MIIETEEAYVHHVDAGPTVVVTFSHLDYPAKGDRFWGDYPLSKLNYSAIGVVSKRDVWFPPVLMGRTMKLVAELCGKYEKVVTYGFSMGAYGALKYSRHLKADTVLALSPQASIDIHENPHIDPRFYIEEFHRKAGINSTDVSGNAYLVYDPFMTADNWSAAFVKKAYSDLRLVPAPRAQHETIDLVSSTEAIGSMLDACIRDDFQRVVSLVKGFRKNSHRVVNARLAYLEERLKRGKS